MGVSVNMGSPKWMVYSGKSSTKIDEKWGYHHDLGNLQIFLVELEEMTMMSQCFSYHAGWTTSPIRVPNSYLQHGAITLW